MPGRAIAVAVHGRRSPRPPRARKCDVRRPGARDDLRAHAEVGRAAREALRRRDARGRGNEAGHTGGAEPQRVETEWRRKDPSTTVPHLGWNREGSADYR